ncbi:MAG TPA: class F sortase [Acidimicrobiia bacterium]|nr:class F sortase [Acidimicrobiia bacterium]
MVHAMKKIGSTAWRVMGLLGILLGVGLVIVATQALTRAEDSAVGDAAGIEQSLGSAGPTSDTTSLPATTSESEVTSEPQVIPLWQANEGPALGEPIDPGPAPTGLRIEAIGVEADILPYGVDRATGQMEVPENVVDVAWYRYGPSPGEAGSAVLAAHVDLAGRGPGVFFDLDRLQPGDLIAIDFDDGSEALFSVQARATHKKDDLPTEVIFSRYGPPVLTLVTCGGGFDSSTSRYDSNVVVYARPLAEGRRLNRISRSRYLASGGAS